MRVGFEETSLTVSESQESVEICVNSTSPGIEEKFTVNITSDNEGMLYSAFIYCQIVFVGIFQNVHQFEIVINSSSLSDFQCYNQSYDFASSDICSYFRECKDMPLILSLTLADGNRLVLLTKDSLEIVVKVPFQCCSVAPSSSSLGDAEIAAVVLGVLVAMTILATISVLVFFFFRERRKKL